jgi:hypothetical protein
MRRESDFCSKKCIIIKLKKMMKMMIIKIMDMKIWMKIIWKMKKMKKKYLMKKMTERFKNLPRC